MVIGTLLVVVPASPASAIQTIAWTSPPPASAGLGQTFSFSWTGRADTFLGARITGCFANFPDAPNYSNSFGGNFTSGSCQYTNRVATTSPTYSIQVGFYLSTGGQITMSWNINVAAPSPTLVNLPAGNTLNLTADNANGGTIPTWNVFGQDQVYGTYSGTCSPSAGVVLNAGTYTGSCSATNGAGRTTTQAITINIARGTPAIAWSVPSQYTFGGTWAQATSASVTTAGLQGSWTYTEDGVEVSANAPIPVGVHTLVGTWTPSGTTASNWNSLSTYRQVVVAQGTQSVSFASAPSNTTYGSAPFSVSAVGTAGGGQVSITSQTPSRCTVTMAPGTTNVTATITITGAGTCTLQANQAATTSQSAATPAVWNIAAGKATPTVTLGGTSQITYGTTLAAAMDAAGSVPGTISYTLDGSPVSPGAVVDAGAYTFAATLTPTDGTNYTTATTSRTLTVDRADPGITLTPIADTAYGSATPQLTATATTPATRSYSSGTTAICTISTTGSITLLKAGTCTLSVSVPPTTNFSSGLRSLSFTVTKGKPGLAWASPSAISYGTPLGAAQLNGTIDLSAFPYGTPATGTTSYTYGSGLPADGAVLDAGDHDLTATWAPLAGFADRYAPVTATVTIHVDKVFADLSFATPTDITYGTPLGVEQLAATVDGVTGTFTYTVDDGGDPAAGQVLDAGPHTIIATFTPDVLFEANYLSGSTAATLVVNQAGQEITFGPIEPHTFGDAPFTVSATGGGSGNPVVLTTDPGSSCTVEDVTVTITGAGSCILIGSQDGNANYLSAPDATQGVTIDKAAPKLTWSKPHAITFGTTLDGTQLDASVTTPGATGQVHYFLADGSTPANGALLHAGDDQTLVATFEPDAEASANFLPVSETVTISVEKAPQAIAFHQLVTKTFGDADFEVSATGGPSGIPVTFTAIGDACTVTNSLPSTGVVHVTSAGTCAIYADQAGNADYLAAETVGNQQVVFQAPQTVGLSVPGGKTYGDAPFSVDVTPGASTGPVFVSVVGDCTIAGTQVTITGAGACAVTAAQGGDLNYKPAPSVTRSFDISKADQEINFGELGTANFADGSLQAQASGGPSGNPVTFTAAGTACTVLGTTVSIQHAGSCDVTAHQAGDGNHAAAGSVTRTLTVTPQILALAWTPSGLTYGDPIGGDQLNATVTPAVPGTWSYTASAGDVLDAGTHDLHATFTPEAAGDILPASGQVAVTVDKANQAITFGQIAAHTFGDAPFGVTATGGASGQPVTFGATTDGCTATVEGTVTITTAADCTIAADQAGTSNFNAAPTVSRSFGVGKASPTIAWATPAAITFGTPLGDAELAATATFDGQVVEGTFTYGPSAGEVLHASTTPQQLSVTFAPTNTRDFTGASASTTVLVNRAPQSIAFAPLVNRTYGDAPFPVTATGGGSGKPVTFSATGDCSASDSVVVITGAGSCTVTADQAGSDDYLAATPVPQTFAIDQQPGTVALGPIGAHSYGDAPFALTAVPGPSSGALVYAALGACAVSPTGQVSIDAAGPCSLTVTQRGDRNHTDASATQVITVAKAAQVITFGALADRSYGDAAFTVTATAGASGTPVTFSATGTACSVAGSTVTVLAAGSCTITADEAGSASHLPAAPVSQTLTVRAGTLTITAQSANRAYGQANPAFTYAVTGYVSGDSSSVITTAPTCTTAATVTSPAGTYPVTCSGALSSNYRFAYKPGTLSVGKAATRLTITSPSIAVAGTTTVTATLTDARTGAAIDGEPVAITGDLAVRTGTSSPATATFSFGSGLHVIGALYFGDENHWPALDAQLLTSYQKTNFVIWGANAGGLKTGDDYTFYGSQWSKQVKQGTNGAGSSFKGYAASVNAAGTQWTSTNGTQPPSTVGDVISVLVTTSTAKSGNNLSGNVTKQVLLLVHDADSFRTGSNEAKGELLTTL
jgi:hypothetical protein